MTVRPAPLAEKSISRLTLSALTAIFLLVGVLGGLAATTRISGAVIAQGTLVVDSYVKPVQHIKGGTVGEVYVKNGDHVTAGEILVHLDATQTQASLAIISKRLNELSARSSRLAAERDARDDIAFPASLLGADDAGGVAEMVKGETRLFIDRRASRTGKKAQLDERINQLTQQAIGLGAQLDGKTAAIAIIAKELAALQPLLEQHIIPATRVYSLQRDAADANGELGSIEASLAEAKAKIAETRLQIIQVDDDQRMEVSDQLRQAQNDAGEFAQRLLAAQDEMKHIDIRAPEAGVVNQLAVHAPGAVIAPGATVMEIVPSEDRLVPEVKLSPQDIDQVKLGQAVVLRFSAFNQRDTPQLNGVVSGLSADLMTDQRTGQGYYDMRLTVQVDEWKKLGRLTPVAGMPVEAFVQTGDRTALAYLTKPFADQVARAFREE